MRRAFYIVFLALMVAGGVMIFATGEKTFSENEKRALKTMSDIENTDDIEKVLTDQFPARDMWLSLSSATRYICGQRMINDTYIAKDGYLFDVCAETDFNKSNYIKNLTMINTFATQNAIDTDVVLIPSPYVILSDKLPANAPVYDADEKYEEAKELLTDVNFIDVRDILDSEKDRMQIYYKTDHHWTSRAAESVYRSIASTNSDTDFMTVTDSFRGTMYARTLLPGTNGEDIEAPKIEGEINITAQGGGDHPKAGEKLYDESMLETSDKYAYFLGGNRARTDIEGKGDKNLLLIKDSYANCVIPLMINDYAHITVVDLRYYNENVSDLLKEGFDKAIVMYEMTNFAKDANIFKLAI